MDMTNKLEKEYYPYFDYLRIVLASVVMFGHDKLIPWGNSGKLSVDVFFALSGWLIGSILIRIDVSKLPQFYFNRALRIWVPYYTAFILLIIASLMKDTVTFKWLEFVVYKFTWVWNIFGPPQLRDCVQCMPLNGTGNHFWSVNAEEQFYLLAPLLLVVFAKSGRQLVVWLLIAACMWGLVGTYTSISLGVLAALANSLYPGFHLRTLSRYILVMLFACATFGLAATSQYNLFSPLFSISLVLLLAVKGSKGKFGSFIGGISYPLYLNHWIGVFFFNLVLSPFGLRDSALRQALAALMNYCIAAFLFWFIERRVLGMRTQLYTRKRGILFTLLAYISISLGLTFGFALDPTLNTALLLVFFTITASVVTIMIIRFEQHKST